MTGLIQSIRSRRLADGLAVARLQPAADRVLCGCDRRVDRDVRGDRVLRTAWSVTWRPPGEISLLALAFITPLVARTLAKTIGLPIGVLILIALYIMVMNRSIADTAAIAAVRPTHA